jgi:hypothetical protein
MHVARRTTHVARRTSHAARGTPHVARRTSHVARRTPHAARRTWHVLYPARRRCLIHTISSATPQMMSPVESPHHSPITPKPTTKAST